MVPIALLLFWRHRENIRQLVTGASARSGSEFSTVDCPSRLKTSTHSRCFQTTGERSDCKSVTPTA